MKTTTARLPGLIIFESRIFTDSRGYFLEVFQQERYIGLSHFVPENHIRVLQ